MKALRVSRRILAVALAAAYSWFGTSAAIAAQPSPGDGGAGVEVLARGPVHEAFAETVTFDPEPGIVVDKAPPEAIEELPPAHKPEGDNVVWISGYWGWNDEDNDYLWISGTWRSLPPGRQWVSGYWGPTRGGVQWTSGYWANAELTEAEYLPEPPQSVESGPNVEAANANQVWLPGSWNWHENRYVWRPGFWSDAQPNWVWVPAHYHWTPRGYVYVDGYWDHTLDRRGMLFAPVRFRQNVYSQRGFTYSPATMIDLAVFANHLFLRPNYGHYYFGDYYGLRYASLGFAPWHSYNSSFLGYDPFYAHQRWTFRDNSQWDAQLASNFALRQENEAIRPPRTFAEQLTLSGQELTEENQSRVFVRSLDQVTDSNKEGAIRLQPVNEAERERFSKLGQEARSFRQERQKLETRANVEADVDAEVDPTVKQPVREIKPERAKLPRSPFSGRGAKATGNEPELPKTQELPQPDPKVVPKARQPRRVNPAIRSRVEPRDRPVVTPKADPKAVNPTREPATETKPERPKVDSPQPRKVEQRPEAEKNTERPKADSPQPPQVERRPGRPDTESKPDAPKPEQKPERKPEQKPERNEKEKDREKREP
jgi:hypothetical protein